MTDAVVVLDARAWAHVAAALTRHVRRCRDDRVEVPSSVRALLDHALASASGRQEPTNVDAFADLLDAAPRMGLLLAMGSAAATLGVSERTVERLVASGQLPSVQVAGCRRIRRSDLESYVAGLGEPTEQELSA